MMKRIELSDGHEIVIGRGLLSRCGDIITRFEKGTRCCVVSDDNVAPIYSERVLDSLNSAGYQASLFVFEHGEKNKHIGTVTQMLNFFAERRLTRHDFIVALGGGVTGDLAGFAAAIYLRGIDVVQLPTSLLAQIDSSVGGKTGCDLPAGKNLAGAFHQPRLVIIDPDVLSTLPDEYMRDGMGEMIKYGAIRSAELFERLENSEPFAELDQNICECVEIKADIVEHDFRENNQRTLLNFGHTVGHAIEKLENFQGLSHGAAVAIGMCAITRAAEKVELCHLGNAARIEALCRKYGLPTDHSATPEEIEDGAMYDKKRLGNRVVLALIRKIGDSFVCPIASDDLHQLLDGCIGNGR